MRIVVILLIAAAACTNSNANSTATPTPTPEPGTSTRPATEGDKGPSTPPAPEADKEPSYPVYSLVDNRLHAHVQHEGGLVVLFGTPALVKYARLEGSNTWDTTVARDGRRTALLKATAGSVQVPLTAEQAASKAVRLQVNAEKPGRLEFRVAGKAVATVELTGGWQTLAIEAPTLKEGENDLEIWAQKSLGLAVEWMKVGGSATDPPADFPYDAAKDAFVLRAGSGLAWYVYVPKDARLRGKIEGGCTVSVDAFAHGGASAKGALGSVDLSPLQGAIARVELRADGCAEGRLAAASLSLLGAAPEVKRGEPPKHVILWIMDSLRADKVKPFHAAARPEVPMFEKLAENSAVFANATVQGNESRVSHASIWSALYPSNHRMVVGGNKLDARFLTIGEAARDAGLHTVGVSANGYVAPKWGFGDGWNAYRNHIHEGGGLTADDILRAATGLIEPKKAEPFFLYMGSIDTHVSWRAKEPWLSKYDPEPYTGRYKKEVPGADIDKAAAGKLTIDDRDRQRIVAIYDSNVSYQDEVLGKLIAQLETWGIANDTMIIITADHGDELWEHGRVGHGATLRDILTHVPLLVHYPPLFPGGRIEEGAESVDILPTILDALGKPVPEDLQGQSLIPLANGVGRGYPRPAISSLYENAFSVRMAGWKLHWKRASAELYHVEEDVLEKQDLADSRPIERRFMTDTISLWAANRSAWKKARWGVASNVTAQFAADVAR